MSYKLTDSFGVMRLFDMAGLPCQYIAGQVFPLDPYSRAVKEFSAWVALGNVPLPDPPPAPNPRLVADENERVLCTNDAPIMTLVNQTRSEWRTWAGTNFLTLTAAERTRLGDLFWVVAIAVRRMVR